MKVLVVITSALLLSPAWAAANQDKQLYRWVDKEGHVHFGDSVPAEYAEVDKQVVNRYGVAVKTLRGKKSDEELAEEKRQEELARELELQRRADQALLATYMSVDEILMHRDRRVELFQAQTRVTELYLRNIQRRLESLMLSAQDFQPYSSNPDAPMIGHDLTDDIATTRETIERHEGNLKRFKSDESNIVNRFEKDMNRFKRLKGLNAQAAATVSTEE